MLGVVALGGVPWIPMIPEASTLDHLLVLSFSACDSRWPLRAFVPCDDRNGFLDDEDEVTEETSQP